MRKSWDMQMGGRPMSEHKQPIRRPVRQRKASVRQSLRVSQEDARTTATRAGPVRRHVFAERRERQALAAERPPAPRVRPYVQTDISLAGVGRDEEKWQDVPRGSSADMVGA